MLSQPHDTGENERKRERIEGIICTVILTLATTYFGIHLILAGLK